MKTTIQVELHPFPVPDRVILETTAVKREDGFYGDVSYLLSDLDSGTLDQLCDEFRDEVFRKAGKEPPRRSK